MTEPIQPKTFISYSWSSPDHEEWVMRLATELRESGVDVILDKWDLREGHDSIAFMEQMVTNKEVKKVLLICDEAYATKTDTRKSGVGIEAQIISPALYSKSDQDKFLAIVAERDAEGKAFLPTYYNSRIYIDLSSPEQYAANYEKLQRWIFNKPLNVKPELGRPPAFIAEANTLSLGTSSLARLATDAVRSGKSTASGALDEYLTVFVRNLERFRISGQSDDFDEHFLKSISEFVPARNEFIGIINTLALYGDAASYGPRLHRFFESVLCCYFRPEEIRSYNDTDFDNFKFIGHELFLSALAIFIHNEKFQAAKVLLNEAYYVPAAREHMSEQMLSFENLWRPVQALEHRNERLNLRRSSLRADLLKERFNGSGIEFRQIMQADFICYLLAQLNNNHYWWPETLVYAERSYSAFEIFARSESRVYLPNLLVLLGGITLDLLKQKIQALILDKNSLPRWSYTWLDVSRLAGFDRLGSRP